MFPATSTQDDVYNSVVRPLVQAAVQVSSTPPSHRSLVPQGASVSVTAIGGRKSGRSFTMRGTQRQPGLVPLTLEALLRSGVTAHASHIHIEGDRLIDAVRPAKQQLRIQQDKNAANGPVIRNAALLPIHHSSDFFKLLRQVPSPLLLNE